MEKKKKKTKKNPTPRWSSEQIPKWFTCPNTLAATYSGFGEFI